MHVALVAPLVSPIHDDLTPLGGAQAFVADLAHGLIDAGHRVTVLAADGSIVRGAELPLLGIDSSLLRPADFSRKEPRTDTLEQTSAFQRIRSWLDERTGEIDLAHGHAFDAPCFLALMDLEIPVLHTLHLPPLDDEVTNAARFGQATATYVAVSEASEAQWRARGIEIARCIHPGLNLDLVPFREEPGGFLLFAGRITPEKGPDLAIEVAAALNQPLVIAGEVYDRQYFEHEIAPRVQVLNELEPGNVPAGASYVGPQSRSELLALMSQAAGVLMPAAWDEPFGLVGIEAQATGTPVVAFRRGGLTEVVENGKTGWLVTPGNREEFQMRVGMLGRMDRRYCRQRIEALFSMRVTVDKYSSLYNRLLKGEPQ